MARFSSKTLRDSSEFYSVGCRCSFRKAVQLREMAASAVGSAKFVPQMAAHDDIVDLKRSETTHISHTYICCVFIYNVNR